MIRDTSYGAIVYRKEGQKILYLLLLYSRNGREWWDFPKGHAESGEEPVDAMGAELREETGLREFEVVDGFREKEHFFYREGKDLVSKTVTFFLVKTDQKDVHLSYEHKDAAWLPYEEAIKRVTFKTASEVLTKAYRFVMSGKTAIQKKLV